MTGYRRNFVPGGSYFFTVNLADRRLRLLTQTTEALRAAFRYARLRHPFTINAIVVLPDHLHAIWSLPGGEADFVGRVRDWPYSSFHRLVRLGTSPANWGGELNEKGKGGFGER